MMGAPRSRRWRFAGAAAAALTVPAATAPWAQQAPDQDTLDRGRLLYARHCAVCHGVVLEGMRVPAKDKPGATAMVPPIGEGGLAWRHSDAILHAVVRVGEHALASKQSAWKMPSMSYMLKSEEIRTVLAYVKSTWSQEQRARQVEITARAQRQREIEGW